MMATLCHVISPRTQNFGFVRSQGDLVTFDNIRSAAELGLITTYCTLPPSSPAALFDEKKHHLIFVWCCDYASIDAYFHLQ